MWEREPLRYSDKPITEYINSEQSSITSQYFLRAKQVLQFVYIDRVWLNPYINFKLKSVVTHMRGARSLLFLTTVPRPTKKHLILNFLSVSGSVFL